MKNIHAFGYDWCSRDDLFSEYVCLKILISMLNDEENIGRGRRIETVRLAILSEAQAALPAALEKIQKAANRGA